jgi:hypothetical protein
MMATKTAIHTRWLLSFMLACCLLFSEQGDVRADDGTFTGDMRSLVAIGAANPLQAAIWEADLNACYASKSLYIPTARTDCEDEVLPPNIYSLALVVNAARYILKGTWTTRAIYPGQGASDGTMTVDSNNMGTLTSGGGSATLLFSKYNDPAGGPAYIVYAYRTSAGDSGSGALLMSDDGCLLYGGYHSRDDPQTIGNFLMARC